MTRYYMGTIYWFFFLKITVGWWWFWWHSAPTPLSASLQDSYVNFLFSSIIMSAIQVVTIGRKKILKFSYIIIITIMESGKNTFSLPNFQQYFTEIRTENANFSTLTREIIPLTCASNECIRYNCASWHNYQRNHQQLHHFWTLNRLVGKMVIWNRVKGKMFKLLNIL